MRSILMCPTATSMRTRLRRARVRIRVRFKSFARTSALLSLGSRRALPCTRTHLVQSSRQFKPKRINTCTATKESRTCRLRQQLIRDLFPSLLIMKTWLESSPKTLKDSRLARTRRGLHSSSTLNRTLVFCLKFATPLLSTVRVKKTAPLFVGSAEFLQWCTCTRPKIAIRDQQA